MTAATREERAELEALRDDADRAAADAARTLSELAGRLSPRTAVTRSRARTLKIAAVVVLAVAGGVVAVGITRVIAGSHRA